MEDTIRSWLYSLLIGGCFCSLILFLNTDTKVRPILETGCSCVMLLMFLSPLRTGEINLLQWSKAPFGTSSVQTEQAFGHEEYARSYIESEYAAYVLNEASLLQVELQDAVVQTVQDESGLWIPHSIIYTTSGEVPTVFQAHIAEQLGVPQERQITHGYSKTDS